jgi:hypothetical protein
MPRRRGGTITNKYKKLKIDVKGRNIYIIGYESSLIKYVL